MAARDTRDRLATSRVQIILELQMGPVDAFDALTDELSLSLSRHGIRFEPSENGRITENSRRVGRVAEFRRGEAIIFEWSPPDWASGQNARVSFRFEGSEKRTRVVVEQTAPSMIAGEDNRELVGWLASEIITPLLRAYSPTMLGEWLTDRRARRPSGLMARETYRNPIYHRPNFRAILAELHLSKDDYLLEVGCGGGAFLHDALQSGCRAAAVDHSTDMVRLAIRVNDRAVREKRLEVLESEADALPFEESTFTCAVMTGVFGFLPHPSRSLSEVCRTLRPGGRFVMFTGSKELRGTPAAPEPMASRLRFYEDEELVRLALEAGFAGAHVVRPDLSRYAEESGVPKEAVPLFSGRSGQLLTANKAHS